MGYTCGKQIDALLKDIEGDALSAAIKAARDPACNIREIADAIYKFQIAERKVVRLVRELNRLCE